MAVQPRSFGSDCHCDEEAARALVRFSDEPAEDDSPRSFQLAIVAPMRCLAGLAHVGERELSPDS